jgi:hypothetical protein
LRPEILAGIDRYRIFIQFANLLYTFFQIFELSSSFDPSSNTWSSSIYSGGSWGSGYSVEATLQEKVMTGSYQKLVLAEPLDCDVNIVVTVSIMI